MADDSSYPSAASNTNGPRRRLNREDSDLDPAAFLKNVRELSEKRDREDAERFKKLEEEVQKGREERAARRAERARSISPQKQSVLPSPPTSRLLSPTAPNANLANSPTVTMTPPTAHTPSAATKDTSSHISAVMNPGEAEVPEFKGFGAIKRASTMSARDSVQESRDSISAPAPSASNLARSGTLSWQQRPRPSSKSGDSRPLSMAAAEANLAPGSNASVEEPPPSRDQIAASLGTRDPTWFRQTAERGARNGAYRKSKEESTQGESVFSGRRGLPGMSRESPLGRDNQSTPPTTADLASRAGSVRESTMSNDSSRYSTTSISSGRPDIKSLIAADQDQQRASPSFDQSSPTSGDSGSISRTLTMSNSQARLANVGCRPTSPVKGMGGFVQSAMMKRSDSQNKRWSAQPSTGLSRQNSVASSRGGGPQVSHSMPKLEPMPNNTETVKALNALSNSSSNEPVNSAQDNGGFVKPALPHHSRSKSVASNYSTNEDIVPQSPSSPSKRFSPTKSSWIESSLTRPESPKPAPSKNVQPGWMADLAKSRAQRASVESTPLASPSRETDSMKPLYRPVSPTINTPFEPALIKRSVPRTESSPTREAPKTSGSESDSSRLSQKLLSTTPIQQEVLTRPELGDLPKTPQSATSTNKLRPNRIVDKFEVSPAGLSKPMNTQSLLDPDIRAKIARPEPQISKSSLDEIGGSLTLTTSAAPKTAKTETLPKPLTEFRGKLKSRPPSEAKSKEEPEFLQKFGALRRTQQERYVAPDVLKDNILRGKSDLAVTGGPVKTERKDEFKDSLQSRKEDIKKAKEEGRELPGQMHQRKTSQLSQGPPAPSKPEALAKKELLGRSGSTKTIQQTDRIREATPEALSRHKSLRSKELQLNERPGPTPAGAKFELLSKQISAPSPPTAGEAKFEPLSKQTSESSPMEAKPLPQTSKLATRFNPGLAGLLARGPPSGSPSRTGSPANAATAVSSDEANKQPVPGAPLQDMRKGRAKGPRRRAGAKTHATDALDPAIDAKVDNLVPTSALSAISPQLTQALPPSESSAPVPNTPVPKPKPQAVPGSEASVMRVSLSKGLQVAKDTQIEHTEKPAAASKSPLLLSKSAPKLSEPASAVSTEPVPEFKGFGAARAQKTSHSPIDSKAHSDQGLPSVQSAASSWGKGPSPQKHQAPSQIQLPSRKDEEAAMKSAGLLASSSSDKSQYGLGIASGKSGESGTANTPTSPSFPPKPVKSSRIVSGQLAGSSSNKGVANIIPTAESPKTETGQFLRNFFGNVPTYRGALAVNASALLANCNQGHDLASSKTVRKSIQVVSSDGSTKFLSPREEYTLFDNSAYICVHVYNNAERTKNSQSYLWAGDLAPRTTMEIANAIVRKMPKETGSAEVRTIQQGLETASFLQTLGGILITRRGSRDCASKQYMLCGRKHLGHIVFDEVDFGSKWLCAGFVYLISYPVTLQETRLYLWKGQGCSAEELSAARLAAMDLSETGEIVEVDGGAEFSSFLKILGATKSNIAKPSELWQQKAILPDKFDVRLYRMQRAEAKTGLFTSFWDRRPSWKKTSPVHEQDDVKVDVQRISPFAQAQLEAEGIYLLDAYSEMYILVGPLFASQLERIRDTLFVQTLLLASDYAALSASKEDRPVVPKSMVLFSGVPRDVKMLFRHWNDSGGLWGTAGLMAGSTLASRTDVKLISLDDVLREVCRTEVRQ